MRESVVEGCFYAAMVGFGEIYFVADAVRLGAGALALGLVVALPLFVGSLGALASHALLSRGLPRKRAVLLGASGQVLVFAAIIAFDHAGHLDPQKLIALVCVYHLCGQVTGVAWASLFGDLVPEGVRGRYFAGRNRAVHAVTCVATLVGGGLLHGLESGTAAAANGSGGTGYLLIFAIAGLCRLISAVLLARAPDAGREGTVGPRLGSIRVALAPGGFARRVVVASAALYFAVYLASPYFGPHMLEGLRFTYLEYTLASVASVVAKVTILPAWGRVLTQHAARSSFLVALIGIAVIPIPWLLSGSLLAVVAAQMLSGAAWGGHELSQFTMILEGAPSNQRTAVFAAMGAVAGTAQLAGTLVGAGLIDLTDFRGALVATTLARCLVALLAPSLIPPSSSRAHAPRRQILLRLAGMRPSGGVGHRPLPVEIEDPEAGSGAADGDRGRSGSDQP